MSRLVDDYPVFSFLVLHTRDESAECCQKVIDGFSADELCGNSFVVILVCG